MIITGQNQVCAGTEVLFASSPVNCGNSPTYAWKVENTSGTTTMGTSQNFLYAPSDGDIITCEVTPDPAVVCPSASVAVSSPINMVVNTNVTPTISIGTTATSICEDGSLTFTANVTFEGDAPHYQWKVNDNNAGSDSPSFDYIPADYAPQTNNAITCVLTSNSPCATTPQVTSNSVNITVNPILTASVTIAADANPVYTGETVTLTATPVNGGNSPSYQWYNGTTAVGSGGATYSYQPNDGDVISVSLTSNATPCLAGSPATSNTVIITVIPRPMLKTTVNGVTVTNNNDGNNDVESFDVCNSAINNLFFTPFADLNGLTPSGSVKVMQQFTRTNVSFIPVNGSYPLSAFGTFSANVKLVDAGQVGTLEMRFRAFFDINNNNSIDAGEGTSDWVVYTVTVNPVVAAGVSIAVDANPVDPGTTVNFTATPVNGGTPSYQWYKGTTAVGTDSPTYSYIPVNGDVISVKMTSSIPCATGSPATSSALTMAVNTARPMIQTTVNGVTITNNNDGNNDVESFDVCNSVVNNLFFTPFADLNGLTPSGSVKVMQQFTRTNVSFIPVNGSYPLSAFGTFSANVKLVDAGQVGTLEMRFRAFFDINNNNSIDAGEGTSDWVVYTVTVNPVVAAGVSIAVDANPVDPGTTVNFTATPVNGGTPSYQWYKGTTAVGTDSPTYSYIPVNGDVISVKMTSSIPCTTGNPVTSNALTMAVNTASPMLKTTVNGVTVTNNNDGNNDVESFDVCNSVVNNLFFTPFADLNGLTPSGSVKVSSNLQGRM